MPVRLNVRAEQVDVNAMEQCVGRLARAVRDSTEVLGITRGGTDNELMCALHTVMPNVVMKLKENDHMVQLLCSQEALVAKLRDQNTEYIARLKKGNDKVAIQKNSDGSVKHAAAANSEPR